jgi:hypothetical protein
MPPGTTRIFPGAENPLDLALELSEKLRFSEPCPLSLSDGFRATRPSPGKKITSQERERAQEEENLSQNRICLMQGEKVTLIGAPQRTKRNGTLVRVMSESDGAVRRNDLFSPLIRRAIKGARGRGQGGHKEASGHGPEAGSELTPEPVSAPGKPACRRSSAPSPLELKTFERASPSP